MLASIVLAVALTGHFAGEDVAQFSELLSIPSVSDDAGECDRATEWMKSYLESRGVWCKVLYAPEANGRKVLYASTVPELKNPDYIVTCCLAVGHVKLIVDGVFLG